MNTAINDVATINSIAVKKPSILLIEDDDATAYVLKYLLQREGYDVIHVSDGNQVYDAIKNNPPFSLALLDMRVPYKNGKELMSDIRALQGWGTLPVIMLSTKSQEKDIVDALEAGATDYIVKPFQPREVLARIRKSVPNQH